MTNTSPTPQGSHKADAPENKGHLEDTKRSNYLGLFSFSLIHDQRLERPELLLTAVNG